MITRESLEQYSALKREQQELNRNIADLEERISDIEHGKVVRDKVRGGEGGWQSFVIEGIPPEEYTAKKTSLATKKLNLLARKATLMALEETIDEQLNELEQYICGIKDCQIRLIIRFKYIDGLSWRQVARKMGGNNTENGVKTAFHRFFKKNGSCNDCND